MRTRRKQYFVPTWLLAGTLLLCTLSRGPARALAPQAGALQGEPAAPSPEASDTEVGGLLEGVADRLTSLVLPGDEDEQAPRWNSLRSPRHTLLTFEEAMQRVREGKDDWERALQALPGSSEGEGDAARRATAHQLKQVFDRLGGLVPLLLPGPETVKRRGISRFVFFPAAEFAWVWEQLDGAPEGSIELALDDGGEWRFTPETVAGAAALLDSLRGLPPKNAAENQPTGLRYLFSPTLERTPWWAWIAFFGAILAGVAAGHLGRKLLLRAAAHSRERGWNMRAAFLRDISSPIYFGTVALALGGGLGLIHLSEALSDLRWTSMRVLLLVVVGWSVLNLVGLLGEGLRRFTPAGSQELDEMLIPLVVKAVRLFLAALLATAVLQNIMGLDVTGFLAGLGIAGLALSLAAKESLQNVLGSMTIFLDKPFRVGDIIRFNGSFGTVTSIGLRSTRIRLLDGEIVVQPNRTFVGDKVENVSLRPHIRRELRLALPYESPVGKIEQAVEILQSILRDGEIAERGNFDLDLHPPRVSLCALGESYLELRAYYWYGVEGERDSGWFDYLDHCQLVNLRVLRTFADAGIEITFPTRRVLLSRDETLRSAEIGQELDGTSEPNGRARAESRARGPAQGPGFDPADVSGEHVGDDGDA